MNKLIVKTTGDVNKQIVKINGEFIDGKTNAHGTKEYVYYTEKEKAEINVYTFSELKGKGWLFYSLFLFVISIFGLLDIGRRKYKGDVVFKAEVTLKENTLVTLRRAALSTGGVAFEVDADVKTEVAENRFYKDETVVKRIKTLRIIKAAIIIAVVIAAAVTIAIIKIKGN